MKKTTYLWNFFAGLFFLFLSSSMLINFVDRYEYTIFSEEYPIIGSSHVTNLLAPFLTTGFFLGIAPFVFFVNPNTKIDRRIFVWLGTIVLAYFIFLVFREFTDDSIRSLIQIAMFYFMSAMQFGAVILGRCTNILEQGKYSS
jgi:hypothetical protein